MIILYIMIMRLAVCVFQFLSRCVYDGDYYCRIFGFVFLCAFVLCTSMYVAITIILAMIVVLCYRSGVIIMFLISLLVFDNMLKLSIFIQ